MTNIKAVYVSEIEKFLKDDKWLTYSKAEVLGLKSAIRDVLDRSPSVSAPTMPEGYEKAWLVEKDIGGFPNYLYCDCIGLLSWTPSNQKAMRFARKEDADSIVSIVEDSDRVAEHMWLSANQGSDKDGL